MSQLRIVLVLSSRCSSLSLLSLTASHRAGRFDWTEWAGRFAWLVRDYLSLVFVILIGCVGSGHGSFLVLLVSSSAARK